MEFLTKDTHIEQPYFLYDPMTDRTSDSLDGDGVLIALAQFFEFP